MYGTTVYQGFGTDVSPEMSFHEMRVKAGLDWEVRKVPNDMRIDGEHVPVASWSIINGKNRHKFCTVDSDDWNPILNETQFNWIERLAEMNLIKPHSMGKFKEGRIVWVMATINDKFDLFEGDTIEGNLLFTNFHEYGRSIDIRNTAMRWSCLNSFLYGLSKEVPNHIRINHRTEFDADYVNETLGLAKHHLQKFRESAEFLASKRATPEAIHDYVTDLFPNRVKEDGTVKTELTRPARQVLEHVHDQPGAEFGEGTWWQAFNAVTYAVDHVHGTDKNRQESAWYGTGEKRKTNALVKSLEYAERA